VENLLEKVDCGTIISDKFGKEELLERAMMSRGRQVELIQQVRGEENPAVAAASILARAEFLKRLEQLSGQWQVTLPKGASSAVDSAGKIFVEKWGADKLKEVAKLHFKNRQKIGQLLGKLP
jgi:ribonuclease HIII